MSKREATKPTNYEELRTKFDQIRPVIASNEQSSTPDKITNIYTSSPNIHIPTVAILTHSAIKPKISKNIMECFDPNNPHSTQWKHSTFQQYDKNASYRVFTKPQPIATLPEKSNILKSVLATSVKPTKTRNLWMLGICHCVNGKTIKGQ